MAYYAFEIDDNYSIIGLHVYMGDPVNYPDNEIPCTEEQSKNPLIWDIDKKTKSIISASKTKILQQKQLEIKKTALDALKETDMVFMRCGKAGIAFPIEWQKYTNLLRAIVNGSDLSSMPEKPQYPEGT